ncbi:dienelactone hydrolase family protein [Lentzea sp. NPDC034063]|uniref:alpha/beta hydrolase family esterase n=1 Tax=unclassified Lentzea TaxID=2643253 RepID=UPI00340A9F0B
MVGSPDGAPGRTLVLVFHGSKQTADKHRAFTGNAFDDLTADGAAVLAYLDGYRGNWNDARREASFAARKENIDDVEFVKTVIERLRVTHGVDPRKVFAVGYSNGGQMVMRLVHEVPELISGAAVFAATMATTENFLIENAPAVPMPILLVHGTKDPIVSFGGGTFNWWQKLVFKVGGRNRSAPETARYFADRNGITSPPVTTTLAKPRGSADPTTVERTDYRQTGRQPVVFYAIDQGGHTIPGPAKAPGVLGKTSHGMNAAHAVGTFFHITN